MSGDLIVFLLAQLALDEAAAKGAAARGAKWSSVKLDPEELGDAWWLFPPFEIHVRRHDPARVLREVEAKRLIIAAHNTTVRERMRSHPDYGQDYWCDTCSHENPAGRWCRTLLLLASAWSDHPDYRQEWKP
jgi:hypothetical protein